MVCVSVSGSQQCKRLSPSQTLSSKLKKTLTSRYAHSVTGRVSASTEKTCGTMSPVRGKNSWARERVKAHTKRWREHHITRQNFEGVYTQKHDSTADDVFHTSSDKLSMDADKSLVSELSVDTALSIGAGSTPKSSPASFSDVSITLLFRPFSANLLSEIEINLATVAVTLSTV